MEKTITVDVADVLVACFQAYYWLVLDRNSDDPRPVPNYVELYLATLLMLRHNFTEVEVEKRPKTVRVQVMGDPYICSIQKYTLFLDGRLPCLVACRI
jgi:hypothetical protein